MTSLVAKYVAKKILGETAENKFGKEDPYFERVPAADLGNGAPKKKAKRQPKALPAGLSERDQKILIKARRRAYILDYGFNLCGIRFGMSSLIGLIPAFGDFLDLFMALMVVRTCQTIDDGLPTNIRSKMYTNIVLDFFVGLVPFLGDIADALYRCNTRNVVLLEQHLNIKGQKALAAGRPNGLPGSEPGIGATAAAFSGTADTVNGSGPARPEPAAARKGRAWFSLGGRRAAPDDIERNRAGLR